MEETTDGQFGCRLVAIGTLAQARVQADGQKERTFRMTQRIFCRKEASLMTMDLSIVLAFRWSSNGIVICVHIVKSRVDAERGSFRLIEQIIQLVKIVVRIFVLRQERAGRSIDPGLMSFEF